MTNLKQYLDEHGTKRGDFAEMVGISRGYLSLLENEKRRPDLVLATRIERATNGEVRTVSWVSEQDAALTAPKTHGDARLGAQGQESDTAEGLSSGAR